MTPEVRSAIDSEMFSHARQRSWCRVEIVYIYHRDPVSPSGVRLAASTTEEDTEALDYLRSRRGTSPLSPTEY